MTYTKTGLTQDLVCDPRRFDGDDVLSLRDYIVHIGFEPFVWQPVGVGRVCGDATRLGAVELRGLGDGKVGAVVGSEGKGEGEGETRRWVMVRGEWAPGTEADSCDCFIGLTSLRSDNAHPTFIPTPRKTQNGKYIKPKPNKH